MKKLLVCMIAATLGAVPSMAQSLEDLNIQLHGYATQGFVYSSANNVLTMSSSNGSPAWSEAVVNVTSQPTPKLRIGVQARYGLMGNLGNAITLDWAAADYKVNDKFGVRFGKVKTPVGLFNEIQDIDPGFNWVLLPQSVYPIESRNSMLAHYGGVVYGTIKLGANMGKLEYRGYGGERVMSSNDGYFLILNEEGLVLPNGISGVTMGGSLHWKTPISGLMIGASDAKDEQWSAPLTSSFQFEGLTIPLTGTFTIKPLNIYNYFGRYEKNKIMFAAEYNRLPATAPILLTSALSGPIPTLEKTDERAWYGMFTYKVTSKLTAGVYESQFVDHQAALGPSRYQKDWNFNGRYDFNSYLYAKAEEHFIQGDGLNLDLTMNPNGTTTNFKLTLLKIGVSF
jgi:hypothetical protein